jgi:predicted DCC family thiol-disulfide oxidoreductase YuxK
MNNMPPYMSQKDKLILFDGVCKLCHAWSRFIIKYDKRHIFKLATVQSTEGQAILKHFAMPTDSFDTILYIDKNGKFAKSEAFLEIIKRLGFPWKLLIIGKIIPKKIRNWLYDRVAKNRYALFGKYEQCFLPTKDHNSRFLSDK